MDLDLEIKFRILNTNIFKIRDTLQFSCNKIITSIEVQFTYAKQSAVINRYRNNLLENLNYNLIESIKKKKFKKKIHLASSYNVLTIEPIVFLQIVYQKCLVIRNEFNFVQKFKYAQLNVRNKEQANLSEFLPLQTNYYIINLKKNVFFIYNYQMREFGVYLQDTKKTFLKCVKLVKIT